MAGRLTGGTLGARCTRCELRESHCGRRAFQVCAALVYVNLEDNLETMSGGGVGSVFGLMMHLARERWRAAWREWQGAPVCTFVFLVCCLRFVWRLRTGGTLLASGLCMPVLIVRADVVGESKARAALDAKGEKEVTERDAHGLEEGVGEGSCGWWV